ncbi:hypothetical protein P692DRAFT_20825172 [Suillus brevipes Sb2]|nr:hypothetical protein P692DRAFT_20825172 [Suillus brevipes Sb2]
MHTASSQSSPAPAVHTDHPTNENMMEPNTATEEPVRSSDSEVDLLKDMSSILKEIRDELKSSNANKERGGGLAEVILAKNISNTLEQAPDNGIKPNNANENPAVSIEGSLAKNMSDTPGQILDVLKGSTIAEERGKDANSKFWATYKKVSTEYDDDFLKWANDDIGIMLTFAGLFSAVNSTFIIGMQPNPGDTTNALFSI